MEDNTKNSNHGVAEAKSEKAVAAKTQKLAYRVLANPHVTEKTSAMEALGKYTFVVSANANKVMVMEAIKEAYGVKPASVSIVKIKGKQVRRGRQVGRTNNLKKAIVTLKSGDSLPTGGAK